MSPRSRSQPRHRRGQPQYGLTTLTCMLVDSQAKGGLEATVRIANAHLVPTKTNLAGEYRSFGELEAVCRAFRDEVNARPNRTTRRTSSCGELPRYVLCYRIPDVWERGGSQ